MAFHYMLVNDAIQCINYFTFKFFDYETTNLGIAQSQRVLY